MLIPAGVCALGCFCNEHRQVARVADHLINLCFFLSIANIRFGMTSCLSPVSVFEEKAQRLSKICSNEKLLRGI